MLSSSVFPSSSFVVSSASPPQNHRLPVLSPDSPSACLSASVLPNCTVAWHQPIISIKISTRVESGAPGVKVFSLTTWLEAHFVVSSKRSGFQDSDPRAVNHPQRWTRGPLWCGGSARFACSWRHFCRDFFFFPCFAQIWICVPNIFDGFCSLVSSPFSAGRLVSWCTGVLWLWCQDRWKFFFHMLIIFFKYSCITEEFNRVCLNPPQMFIWRENCLNPLCLPCKPTSPSPGAWRSVSPGVRMLLYLMATSPFSSRKSVATGS